MSEGALEVFARRDGLLVNVGDLLGAEAWPEITRRLDEQEGTIGAGAQGFAGIVLRHLAKITGWITIVHKGSNRGVPYPWASMCLEAIAQASGEDANKAVVMLNLVQSSQGWDYRPKGDQNKFPTWLMSNLADVANHVNEAHRKLVPHAGATDEDYRPSPALARLLEAASAQADR